MSSVKNHVNDENGSIALNKPTKLRRFPLSRRHGNVVLVSKTSSNSILKPNSIISTKIKKGTKQISPKREEVFENTRGLLSKESIQENTLKKITCSSPRTEPCNDMQPSIFRRMVDCDDWDDMMVLKRASPVYDSDNDEQIKTIPLKRQRTSGKTTTLHLGERLQEVPGGFSSICLLQE